MHRLLLAGIGSLIFLVPSLSWATSISIVAGRDNSVFSESFNSNGAGTTLLSGRNNSGGVRRALLWFDLASQLPAEASVTGVTLTLHLDGAPQTETAARNLGLYRLMADWGEGTSGSGAPSSGQGQPATLGDATWTHTFFSGETWANPGGDFRPAASAMTSVGVVPGLYAWRSTSELIADVQDWLVTPSSNFGWVLRSEETASGSVRRFQSREWSESNWRPTLTIEYQIPEPASALLELSVLACFRLVFRRQQRLGLIPNRCPG